MVEDTRWAEDFPVDLGGEEIIAVFMFGTMFSIIITLYLVLITMFDNNSKNSNDITMIISSSIIIITISISIIRRS